MQLRYASELNFSPRYIDDSELLVPMVFLPTRRNYSITAQTFEKNLNGARSFGVFEFGFYYKLTFDTNCSCQVETVPRNDSLIFPHLRTIISFSPKKTYIKSQ